MNLKNTKKSYIFNSFLLFICILFAILMGNAFSIVNSQIIDDNKGYNPTIVLDAGHGGEDGGAKGISGILEKDINLSIANILKDMFEASGFKVEMIRDSDISIYDSSAKTIREKKKSDLKNRLSISNKSKNNVLLSIHQNEFSDRKYFGTQVFYSENNLLSKELAEQIKLSVKGLLQPENKRETKPANKNIFLLSNSEIPAVIVECGFLSNEEEEKKLTDKEYQGQIAFAIYCGFIQFLNNI